MSSVPFLLLQNTDVSYTHMKGQLFTDLKKSSLSLPAWQCEGSRPAGIHSCMQACPGCCLWAPPPSHHSPKGKMTKQRLRTLSLQPKIHTGEEHILKYIKTRTSINLTSLPASMVSFSRWPSSEPDATMALSMSPVAKWHTQYFSASLGACGGQNKTCGINPETIQNYYQIHYIKWIAFSASMQ